MLCEWELKEREKERKKERKGVEERLSKVREVNERARER